VFAEERTGSTWLCDQLAFHLRAEHEYVEMDREELTDEAWREEVARSARRYERPCVYQTHRFAILGSIEKAALLIHTRRRDLLAQALSFFFVESTRERFPDFWRLPHLLPGDRSKVAEVIAAQRGLTVTRAEVDGFVAKRRARHALWDRYAPGFRHQVIYYEDLRAGVHIEALKLRLTTRAASAFSRLPYTVAEHFANVDEIRTWL
jgi:hypothetical protein